MGISWSISAALALHPSAEPAPAAPSAQLTVNWTTVYLLQFPMTSLAFCRRALADRDEFWSGQARAIHWQRSFEKVCDFSNPPFVRWFAGGLTNLSYNAVDRHLDQRGNQPAIYYLSTEVNEEKAFSFNELYQEINRFAAVLQSLGLQRGDRVVIYLPMIPEAAFAMLACIRLGLIHSVVFAGFAPASLAARIDDAEARLVITADAALRGGKIIPLKRLVDEAVELAKRPPVNVLVCDRGVEQIKWHRERDHDYASLRERFSETRIPPVWLESGETSYLLYTSGTTAQPKGIQRDTGGYAVALAMTMRYLFAGKPGETMFTAADVGWAVGHSYGVYGPLLQGMSTVLYEGLPTNPDGAIWWKIVEKYQATVMFTSPTAIRVLKRQDPDLLHRHNTKSLQRLYLAGEPLDEPTWRWITEALGIPVIDNYWQTETGWPVLALLPGLETPAIRPGSPGIAMPGYDAKIVHPDTGEPLPRGEKGVLAFDLPLPPGCMPTVWKRDEVFRNHYCSQFPGKLLYSTFDYALQDDDGYFFLLGRSDDVINVSGHRLGTREIEETVASHPAVAEAAAVGASDDLKGQAVHCFVVLKAKEESDTGDIRKEISDIIVGRLGAFARPSMVYLVKGLPKTRSGKILRRAILAIAEGRNPGDLSTLEDPVALEAIRHLIEVATG